jgi:hypothetical protein
LLSLDGPLGHEKAVYSDNAAPAREAR